MGYNVNTLRPILSLTLNNNSLLVVPQHERKLKKQNNYAIIKRKNKINWKNIVVLIVADSLFFFNRGLAEILESTVWKCQASFWSTSIEFSFVETASVWL